MKKNTTKVIFSINYQTRWGEGLYIMGNIKPLGDRKTPSPMTYMGDSTWQLEVEFPPSAIGQTLQYNYCVIQSDHIKQEFGFCREILLQENLFLSDGWMESPVHKHLYSSAFVKGMFFRGDKKPKEWATEKLILSVAAPQVPPSYTLAVSGNQKILGNWNEKKMVVMNDALFPTWEIAFDIDQITFPLEFKFAIYDKTLKKAVQWESGSNRVLSQTPAIRPLSYRLSNMQFRHFMQWQGTGVALPVFSQRSENSFGIGEFSDLKLLADWAVETGQKVIQILPINDTTMTYTWADSYPYRAISIYALHPIYLGIKSLTPLSDTTQEEAFETKRIALNRLPEIDYDQVITLKMEYLRLHFQQYGKKALASKKFKEFFDKNKEWLMPYALFCMMRDNYKTACFEQWGEYSCYKADYLTQFCDPQSETYPTITFHYYIQYLLDAQLSETVSYAKSKGIIFKGDIPIGISRDSVEAWTEPELFNMNSQAGAPPDDFSMAGQNWGFPTYNWEKMSQDGYGWWIKRFKKMADYFDAYRIDHILGFFRIWEIPMDAVQGLLGHFNPALPLTANEIRSYGFPFDEQRHSLPYIRQYFLQEFFQEHTQEVIDTFLDSTGWEEFRLKEDFNTQRKIEIYFQGKDDPKSQILKNGLMGLVAEVLFVPDTKEPTRYHPRITAQYTKSYQALEGYVQNNYNRLYNDFFYRRHNYFWQEQAMQKLPTLTSCTDMLVCGEDLGMIPDCVPYVMNTLQILSLEIQRMPKDPSKEFGYTGENPYLSVSTTSTHDMETVRGWWEEDPSKSQRYFNSVLCQQGAAPVFCEPRIAELVLYRHLQCPSMLTIIPLQDWMAIDETIRRGNPQEERINIPADPNHYWRYRMHLTLEELIKAKEFNKKVRHMIAVSSRL